MLDDPALTPLVYVFGPHLSPEFGATVERVEADGIPIHCRLPCLDASDDDAGMARTVAGVAMGLADELARCRPDLVFIPADRYEMLAPAAIALTLRIPIVHLEGGEESIGAIDQSVRDALSALASVHLTTTEHARRRLIAMGEQPHRVHHVGAPSLDHLTRSTIPSQEEIESRLGLDLDRPTLVVALHPTTTHDDTVAEASRTIDAMESVECQMVWLSSNADAGGRAINARAKEFCAARTSAKWIDNLDAPSYWRLLRAAAAMVGNSSGGIMESPSLGIPAVNVGDRQKHRLRAANVMDVPADPARIVAAVREALRPVARARAKRVINPYGDGQSSARIASILAQVETGESLIQKRRDVEGMSPD